MSKTYELIKSRANVASRYVQQSKGAKFILTIAGAVRLNIDTVDPPEQVAVIITDYDVTVSHGLLENPHATIHGITTTIQDLIISNDEKNLSTTANSFEDAEKRGEACIEPHGIKGRLIVSRVRKMLLG